MRITLTQQASGESRTLDLDPHDLDTTAVEDAVVELTKDRPGMTEATVTPSAEAIAQGLSTVILRPDSTPLSFADAMNFLSLDLDI